jgi:hypothetical protein
MNTQFDHQKHYCRKLGHFITFGYCRKEEFDHPCKSIRSCWRDKFDIDRFLLDNFSDDDIRNLTEPSPSKMSCIVELIAAAQQGVDTP